MHRTPATLLPDNETPPATALTIKLLGGAALTLNGQPLTALKSQKGIALFIYLACTRRPHSREVLADLLWDATSTAQSLSNLRTVLTRLRRHLGDYLLVTPETIAIAPTPTFWLDVQILEEQIAAQPRHLSAELATQMEQTLALYQGDFLAGLHLNDAPGFADWALVERERLRFSVLQALQQLAQDYLGAGNHAAGLRVTARLLALDPLNEAAHGQMLRLLIASGQRTAALAHYETCRQIFLAELGVEPDETLQALYAQIRDSALSPILAPVENSSLRPLASHNLPDLPTPFWGRAHEMAIIERQLREPTARLVTLAGEGGVGKSRLALTVGQQLLDVWPDGVWFVPLVAVAPEPAPTLSNRLATAIAAAIHFSFSSNGADPVTQLYNYLCNKTLLLILDNFEHLMAGAPFVASLVRQTPHCRVLVTSREPLHSQAETVLRINGLPTPPTSARTATQVAEFASVQLFVARAQRKQPAFALTAENARALAHLCRLVAGNPLALELAATWVDHFGVAETVDILEHDGLELLAGDGPAFPARHRSLQTVFITSWNLLKPSAQRTLAQASVFRGGFQRQALLAVTDATLTDLVTLVNQSLLGRTARSRYELRELLRQFAETQLQSLEQAIGPAQKSSAARHSRYYLALVGTVVGKGPQAKAVLTLVKNELDNIRRAWRWALTNHDLTALAMGWQGLRDFYLQKMLFQEAEEAFRNGVGELQAWPDNSREHRRLLATLQVAQAVFLNVLTRYDEATELAQTATTFAEASSDDALKARGYLQWGTALYRRGRYDPALGQFQTGLVAARTANLKPVEADILRLIGITLLEKSQFDAARRQLEQALTLYRQVGNRLGEGNALNDLGWLGQREQNFTDALVYLQAAQRVHQEIDNRHGISIVLINMGIVYGMLDEYTRAYACYQEVQRLLLDLDDRYHRSLVNYSLGVLLSYVGDYAAAHTCYLRALAIDHEIGDRAGMAWTQNGLGLLYNHLGDPKTALAYHKEALRSSKARGARTVQGIAYLGLGQDLYELGKWEMACDAYRTALVIQTELGQTVRTIETKSGLAQTLLALKQPSAALALVNEVLDYLSTNTLQGARQPLWIYLNSYRVLHAVDDPRAPALLREAYLRLQQQADKIEDPAWRRSFLENVQVHQAIVQEYTPPPATLARQSTHTLPWPRAEIKQQE